LLTYPKETVVAEKFEAMAKLGIANSRMKDFYDLEILSRTFAFDGKTLARRFKRLSETRDRPSDRGLPVSHPSFMTT